MLKTTICMLFLSVAIGCANQPTAQSVDDTISKVRQDVAPLVPAATGVADVVEGVYAPELIPLTNAISQGVHAGNAAAAAADKEKAEAVAPAVTTK